jgi:hypothetical protein
MAIITTMRPAHFTGSLSVPAIPAKLLGKQGLQHLGRPLYFAARDYEDESDRSPLIRPAEIHTGYWKKTTRSGDLHISCLILEGYLDHTVARRFTAEPRLVTPLRTKVRATEHPIDPSALATLFFVKTQDVPDAR